MWQLKKTFSTLLTLLALIVPMALAHGGEDHGDEKSATVSNEKGTVTRFMRLGDAEITFKHTVFEPDVSTNGNLFVTSFETNEPMDVPEPAIDIESTTGFSGTALVEKSGTGGSYVITLPALPEGDYTIRIRLTYRGETDTATFSNVEVSQVTESIAESEMSWIQAILIGVVFLLVLISFGILMFFVLRFSASEPGEPRETLSV